MATIFLSYRRSSDPHIVARIHDRLTDNFDVESLFRDRDSIKAGDDWRKVLTTALESSKVCLLIIGPDWVSVEDDKGHQRLFQDNDWVRYEVETALRLESVFVIPVLVKDAKLPKEASLPQSLKGFDDLQSVVLNEDYWNEGCERLCSLIGEKTGLTKVRKRMSTALIVLTVGIIYGLLSIAIEFNSGVSVMIDTHLGSLSLLAAGALVLIARTFMDTSDNHLLKYLYIAFTTALVLGIASLLLGWAIWQTEYDAILLDSIVATVMLVASGVVLHGARKIATRS